MTQLISLHPGISCQWRNLAYSLAYAVLQIADPQSRVYEYYYMSIFRKKPIYCTTWPFPRRGLVLFIYV